MNTVGEMHNQTEVSSSLMAHPLCIGKFPTGGYLLPTDNEIC